MSRYLLEAKVSFASKTSSAESGHKHLAKRFFHTTAIPGAAVRLLDARRRTPQRARGYRTETVL
jgi:hypothetical protein